MCTERESRTIAKKATVITVIGKELGPVTVMGPARKVQVGLALMHEVRVYGKNVEKMDDTPWVIVQAVHDRNKRQIL